MNDIASKLVVTDALLPAAINTDTNGITVDRAACNSVTFIMGFGAPGVTLASDVYFNIYLEMAPDNGAGAPGSWVPVTNIKDYVAVNPTTMADATTGLWLLLNADAKVSQNYHIGFIAAYTVDSRFVRIRVDQHGTMATGTPMCVYAIKGDLAVTPKL